MRVCVCVPLYMYHCLPSPLQPATTFLGEATPQALLVGGAEGQQRAGGAAYSALVSASGHVLGMSGPQLQKEFAAVINTCTLEGCWRVHFGWRGLPRRSAKSVAPCLACAARGPCWSTRTWRQ